MKIEQMILGWPRFRHVIKHLYNDGERWDYLTGIASSTLEDEAIAAGGFGFEDVRADRVRELPVPDACLATLSNHHLRHYSKAYMSAVETGRSRGREARLDDGSLAIVGDNGVIVLAVVRSHGRSAFAVSAYRVTPPEGPTAPSQEFVKAAVRRWRDKASLGSED